MDADARPRSSVTSKKIYVCEWAAYGIARP